MSIASGIAKKLILAPQAAQGTPAVANLATAQYLRRTSSTLDLKKDTYQSNEMRADRQIGDYRHGVKSVDGTIAGELSPGTYEKFMAAILRQAWVAGEVSGPESDITVAVTTGAGATFTSASAATFLTDGLKVGDVVRWTGFVQTGTDARANNAHNFLITALTETVMTGVFLDGVPAVAKAETEAVTCTVVGKKSWVPQTAHTEDWFTIEHNYSDVDLSELFWDLKVNSMSMKLPATGMATVDFGLIGLNLTTKASGDAPYFSAVLPESTGGCLAAVNGAVYVQGTAVALITGMDISIAGNLSSEAVVGSNTKPDIFDGKVVVTGNMTVYFQDATFRDYFINETEVCINAVFTTNNTATADFIAISMSRVKVGGSTKDDGDKGLIMSMPFQALFDTGAGPATGATATDHLATTISIQDSTLT